MFLTKRILLWGVSVFVLEWKCVSAVVLAKEEAHSERRKKKNKKLFCIYRMQRSSRSPSPLPHEPSVPVSLVVSAAEEEATRQRSLLLEKVVQAEARQTMALNEAVARIETTMANIVTSRAAADVEHERQRSVTAADAQKERSIMLEENRRAQEQATTERQAIIQMLTQIQQSRTSSLAPPPPLPTQATQPQNAYGELIEILKVREVTTATTISSHRLAPDDELAQFTNVLSKAPAYKWLRNSGNEIKRALRCTVEFFQECTADNTTVKEAAEVLARRVSGTGRQLTVEQAATIQALVICESPNSLWFIAEFSVLARRTLEPSALAKLQSARTVPPDLAHNAVSDGVYGIPIRTARAPSPPRRQERGPSPKRPMKCRFCEAEVTTTWEEHNPTCPKRPKDEPPRKGKRRGFR